MKKLLFLVFAVTGISSVYGLGDSCTFTAKGEQSDCATGEVCGKRGHCYKKHSGSKKHSGFKNHVGSRKSESVEVALTTNL